MVNYRSAQEAYTYTLDSTKTETFTEIRTTQDAIGFAAWGRILVEGPGNFTFSSDSFPYHNEDLAMGAYLVEGSTPLQFINGSYDQAIIKLTVDDDTNGIGGSVSVNDDGTTITSTGQYGPNTPRTTPVYPYQLYITTVTGYSGRTSISGSSTINNTAEEFIQSPTYTRTQKMTFVGSLPIPTPTGPTPVINGFIEGMKRYTVTSNVRSGASYFSDQLSIRSELTGLEQPTRLRMEIWEEGNESIKNIWDFIWTPDAAGIVLHYNIDGTISYEATPNGYSQIVREDNLGQITATKLVHRYYIEETDSITYEAFWYETYPNNPYGVLLDSLTPDVAIVEPAPAMRSYTIVGGNNSQGNHVDVSIWLTETPVGPNYEVTVSVWKTDTPSEEKTVKLKYNGVEISNGGYATVGFSTQADDMRNGQYLSTITTPTIEVISSSLYTWNYYGALSYKVTAEESLFTNNYLDSIQANGLASLIDFNTLTPDTSGPTPDDPNIITAIDSDVLATKNAINAYIANTNNNPTEAELQAQIVQTGTNVIAVSYVNWVATINGSNPTVTYTKTDSVNVTPVDDPAIITGIDSDIAATKTGINNILVWNTTQAELNAVIVQTGNNVITAIISGSNVIINGSNPAVVYTATDSITIPVNPEIAIIAAINSDATNSKAAIENILVWDITQAQVDSVLVITNSNTVTAVVNAHDIIVTVSNTGTVYTASETIIIPDNPEIVASINADVLAIKNAIIATNDMYMTQADINALIVTTGSNVITAVLVGREVTISGSNPTVLYAVVDSVLLPDIIVEPTPEVDLYRWVIYNTNTGVIIKDLPTSADDIYLDINNGDEAKISVPAYALLSEERLNWTQFFKPWARGIALIDTVKGWNDTGKVIFAGPIDKRSFSGRTEMIEITAYSIFESLKKTEAKPVWATITNPLDGKTFEAGSWAGVYSAILQSGLSLTGAPATWKPINTYTDLPVTTGAGKSVSTLTVDHERVSDLWEKIRDEKSENGNEFRLTPSVTDISETTLVWTLEVGSDTNPHINFTDKIVKLDFNSNENWEVVEWELDDDATMIYNKLVINGHNGDTVEIAQATTNADSEMPGLMESFSPGVDLTTEELAAQFAARMKGSLVTEKTLSMIIAGDTNLEWFGLIGRKIIAKPGEKTAGAGAVARAVGIRFSTKTLETDLQVDLVKVSARYPKLPKQKENEQLGGNDNYTDGLNGSDGASYGNQGGLDGISPEGMLPDGTIPGGITNTPELPSDLGDLGDFNGLNNFELTTDFLGTDTRNIGGAEGLFRNKLGTYSTENLIFTNQWQASDFYYNNYLNLENQGLLIESFIININDESEAFGPVIKSNVLEPAKTYIITPQMILDELADKDPYPDNLILPNFYANTAPYSTTQDLTTNIAMGAKEGNSMFEINGWLYVLINTSKNLGGGGIIYRQAMFAAEINYTTGELGPWNGTPRLGQELITNESIRIYTFNENYYNRGVSSTSAFISHNDKAVLLNPLTLIDKYSVFYGSSWYSWVDKIPTTSDLLPIINTVDIDASAPLAFITKTAAVSPMTAMVINLSERNYVTWNSNDNTKPVTGYEAYEYITFKHAQAITSFGINSKGNISLFAIYDNNFNPYWNEELNGDKAKWIKENTNRVIISVFGKWRWKKTDEIIIEDYTSLANFPSALPLLVLENGNTIFDIRENPGRNTTHLKENVGNSSYIIDSSAKLGKITQSRYAFVENQGGVQGSVNIIKKNNKNYYVFTRINGTNPSYITVDKFREVPFLTKINKVRGNGAFLDSSGKLFETGININSTIQPLGVEYKYIENISTKTWSQVDKTTFGNVGIGVSDGKVYTWGKNDFAATGQGTIEGQTNPETLVAGLPDKPVKIIKVTENEAYVLYADGELWGWGKNVNSKIKAGGEVVLTPILVANNLPILDFDVDENGILAIHKLSRDLYYTGMLWKESQSFNGPTSLASWTKISTGNTKWDTITMGNNSIAAIATTGELFTMGVNSLGRTSLGIEIGITTELSKVDFNKNWKQIAFTSQALFALKTDGTLWYSGTMITKTVENKTQMTQIGIKKNWFDLGRSSSTTFTYATNTDDEVYVLGEGSNSVGSSSPIETKYEPYKVFFEPYIVISDESKEEVKVISPSGNIGSTAIMPSFRGPAI